MAHEYVDLSPFEGWSYRHQLLKLEWELGLVAANAGDPERLQFAVVNAWITANHIVDWIVRAAEADPELAKRIAKQIRANGPPITEGKLRDFAYRSKAGKKLRSVRLLCNAGKHGRTGMGRSDPKIKDVKASSRKSTLDSDPGYLAIGRPFEIYVAKGTINRRRQDLVANFRDVLAFWKRFVIKIEKKS